MRSWLLAFALIVASGELVRDGVPSFTAAWRSEQNACARLLSAAELSEQTGLSFGEAIEAPNARAGCAVTWSAPAESLLTDPAWKLQIEVSREQSQEPDAVAQALEDHGLEVDALALGEWALKGEAMTGRSQTTAAVSFCGVLLQLKGEGDAIAPHVEALARLAASRSESLCKFHSNWPQWATGRVTYAGPAPALRSAEEHRLITEGEKLIDAWKYDEAAVVLQKAVDLRESRLGPEHPALSRVLRKLGVALREGNRPGEAEPVLRRALHICTAHDNADERLATQRALARTVAALGRLDEGIALMEGVVQMLDGMGRPEDDAGRVAVLNDLAMLYGDQGDHEREAALLEQVLAADEALDPESLDAANSRNNLAMSYRDSGRLQEATVLFERALATLTVKVGDQHLRLIPTLNGLAGTHVLAKHLSKAEQLARRALDVAKANGSSPDVITLSLLGDIASARHLWADAAKWQGWVIALEEVAGAGETPEIERALVKRTVAFAALHRDAQSRLDEKRVVALAELIDTGDGTHIEDAVTWLADGLERVGARQRAWALRRRADLAFAGAR